MLDRKGNTFWAEFQTLLNFDVIYNDFVLDVFAIFVVISSIVYLLGYFTITKILTWNSILMQHMCGNTFVISGDNNAKEENIKMY